MPALTYLIHAKQVPYSFSFIVQQSDFKKQTKGKKDLAWYLVTFNKCQLLLQCYILRLTLWLMADFDICFLYLIYNIALWDKYYYLPHFTHECNKPQRDAMTYPQVSGLVFMKVLLALNPALFFSCRTVHVPFSFGLVDCYSTPCEQGPDLPIHTWLLCPQSQAPCLTLKTSSVSIC